MMELEGLQSDLLALRRLYGLLTKDEHYVEHAGSVNIQLDENARRFLKELLDVAANKAFDAHAKILGTQSNRNAPTDSGYGKVECQEISSEPAYQVDLAGEPAVRLKRCRVCRKPKLKQLTKEISFRGTKALTSIPVLQNQNHKRRWEDESDPSIVEGSSKRPFLTNLINQEDHISRDASSKILQLESCISSLQVAAKHPDFFRIRLENERNEQKQTGYFSIGTSNPNRSTIWKPREVGHQWRDQKITSISELALQGPLGSTMLPSTQIMSQQVEEPVVKRVEMFSPMRNQYDDHMQEEAYYLFHHGANLERLADKSRVLHRNLSKQINREQLDQLQMGKKEATEWLDTPLEYGRPDNEQQEEEIIGRNKPDKTYSDQMDDHRGKQEVVDPKRVVSVATQRLSDSPVSSNLKYLNQSQRPVTSQSPRKSQTQSPRASQSDPKRLVSAATQRLSDNPVSSSKYSTRSLSPRKSQIQSQRARASQSQSYNSFNESKGSSLESRKVHSGGSSSSRAREKSDSEMNLASEDQRSFEMVPKKGDQKGKSESKMKTVSNWVQSPYKSSSSHESSRSRRTVHKTDKNQKELKKKSESKMNTVSTRDQSPYTSSVSNGSSGSNSSEKVPEKGSQRDLKRKSESSVSSQDQSPYASSENKTGSSQDQSSYTSSENKTGSMTSIQDQSSYSSSENRTGSSQDQSTYTGSSKDQSPYTGSENETGSSQDQTPYTSSGRSSQDQSPYTSSENETGSGRDQSPYTSSGSNESSGSRSTSTSRTMVSKKGNQKEPKRSKNKSQDETPDASSSPTKSSDSKSKSKTMVLKKGNQKEPKKEKESKVSSPDQSLSSGSKESSGSKSKSKVTDLEKSVEKKNRVGALSKLKDKLAVVLHHHHHHHHHHHDEENQKKSIWKKATKAMKKKVEASGEQAVKTIKKKALVVKKDGAKAVKKIGSKALVVTKDGAKAVKKMEKKAMVVLKKDGAKAVKTIGKKAMVLKKDGAKVVKKIGNKALKDGAKAVKTIGNKALVLKKDAKESKALVVKKDTPKKTESKKDAVKKNECKALVVHKGGDKDKDAQKSMKSSQLPLKTFMGVFLKSTRESAKPSKAKSEVKKTTGLFGAKKDSGGSGKPAQKMKWWKALRQQRKVKRIQNLKGKIGTGKKK